jgi:hypothetical protein
VASGEPKAVRDEYAGNQAYYSAIPGELILDNLRNHKHFTIHTGQEDSEVLEVSGDTVIFRVNDELKSMPLAGTDQGHEQLILKDARLTSVHWILK